MAVYQYGTGTETNKKSDDGVVGTKNRNTNRISFAAIISTIVAVLVVIAMYVQSSSAAAAALEANLLRTGTGTGTGTGTETATTTTTTTTTNTKKVKDIAFGDDNKGAPKDDVPVIGKFTRSEIEQAFGLKQNSLIVPTNENNYNNHNNIATSTTTTSTTTTMTMTLFDVLANQNAWTPYENWPLQLDHLNSLLDPATAYAQHMLDVVSQTYTPNMFNLLEGGHVYDEYVFLAGDTVLVLQFRYKVLAYINETNRIVTQLDEKGVPNVNDISNLFLAQFAENCSTPIDSNVPVGWYLIGPNYGPYNGYKGYNGTTSMPDPNRGRMVVSFNHVDLTATLPIDNTTSWTQWILEHRDEYNKPFGEAPICASTINSDE